MNNNIKISVILPIYNVKPFLKRSIESITQQSFQDIEILLIDDGSTDGSNSIIESYENKYENIRVISKSQSGTGAARNTGIDAAVGEYLYFMDPDDWLEGQMLQENYALIDKLNPDVLLFGSYDHYLNNVFSTELENKFFSSKSMFLEEFPQLFKKGVMYTVWNKLYKKSFLQENNLKFGTEKSGEDYLFNIEVYDKLRTIVVNKKKYYHYVVQRKNSATSQFREEMFDLYKNEQFKLIHFMKENGILDKNIIADKWYVILNSSWEMVFNTQNPKKANDYIQNILQEYKKNKYINVRYLTKFKWKLKYLIFFKGYIYRIYNRYYNKFNSRH